MVVSPRVALLAVVLSANFAMTSARAGPFDDGQSAFARLDYATALRLWQPLAAQGSKKAQLAVGSMYENGFGVQQDFAEAVKLYRKAADQGFDRAQYKLGTMIERGRGAPRDLVEAAQWYRKAADQGLAVAQQRIGLLYFGGWGVRRDQAQAVGWFRKAADQGLADAQGQLGMMYEIGSGVPQNFIQSHMWYNLAGDRDARDKLASRMTPAQIAEAQRLASLWRPGPDDWVAPSEPKLSSTGSGFFVTPEGHLLTNAHVVKDCVAVQARRPDGEAAAAHVVALSARDDLALLKVDQRQSATATFRGGAPVKQGDGVTVYGFPLAGLLASTGNLTIGNVTALSGPLDDPRLLQISAAVQPGNSGGPALDSNGDVVGVIVSKLNAVAIVGFTGDIPQNINFAIKASVATNFLEAHGISYVVSSPSHDLPAIAIADRARSETVRVDCLK